MRFNKQQTDFLQKEFNLTVEPDLDIPMCREEWYGIQDQCLEIECDEVLAVPDGTPDSERCKMAMSFCDMAYTN